MDDHSARVAGVKSRRREIEVSFMSWPCMRRYCDHASEQTGLGDETDMANVDSVNRFSGSIRRCREQYR